MMPKIQMKTVGVTLAMTLAMASGPALADEFTAEDVQRWQAQFEGVAETGRGLWGDPGLGTNGVVCGQCHPNASNTHPETYPKFQKQLGRVAQMWQMVNWCIANPLEGEQLAPNDPRMTALLAYIAQERRGVALAPGKH